MAGTALALSLPSVPIAPFNCKTFIAVRDKKTWRVSTAISALSDRKHICAALKDKASRRFKH
jgi:hypothetical protein